MKGVFDHKGPEYIARNWFDDKGFDIATEHIAELVRCRDCKHFREKDDTRRYNLCAHEMGMVAPEKDDYCSMGSSGEPEAEE